MRHIGRETVPTSKAIFGPNWLYRFVRRWGLSWRKATKQKQKVIESRLARIERFHQGLRKLLRDSEGQRGARELDPSGGGSCPGRSSEDSHTQGGLLCLLRFVHKLLVGCKHGARPPLLHEEIGVAGGV